MVILDNDLFLKMTCPANRDYLLFSSKSAMPNNYLINYHLFQACNDVANDVLDC